MTAAGGYARAVRWSLAALVAPLSLAACGAPPSGLPAGVLLRYGVAYMGGETSFEVHADGTTDYAADRPGGKKRVRAKATPAEIDALARVLRDHRFCSLTSHRSKGVPDEARPSIRAHVAEMDCAVTLWDGEWRDDADAFACLSAVEAFGAKLSLRGAPP